MRTGPYPDVAGLDRALRKLLGAMRGLVFGDRHRREDLKPGCLMPARGHNEDNHAAPKYGGKLTYDSHKTLIRCDTCRRAYGPTDWTRLGVAAGLITLPFTLTAAQEAPVIRTQPQPGDIGLTGITGPVGRLIQIGQWLNGDGFGPYEHAFIVVPDDQLIEAEPGGAQVVPLSEYDDREVLYVSPAELTPAQREAIVSCDPVAHWQLRADSGLVVLAGLVVRPVPF
ncbi:hypothetical protein [Streptomyces sp. CA-106131]|uniref:hypothetical protein n=1 Tax=Streptomyces sp. CA-106131 TaxID=3240045 RepID=UPI003D931EA9